MHFEPSPRAREWLARLETFHARFLLPHNAAWHAAAQRGERPAFLTDLRALAREEGLWNLCLPGLPAHAPGTALSHLDYAPLAEAMGRLPWAAEVFNCNAPDSGNMELLLRHASTAQRERWLAPLLAGEIRSAFAMSEPDVASSDPTNLQTEVRREGRELVVSGRKWFVTGVANPDCRLLIVVCRNADAAEGERHRAHSLLLVPVDAPGVEVVRNIPILQHAAPEGHCEIVFRQVRVPQANLLGEWGEGFALAQARLGPGRVHHCMRTIGQCELALALACDRALERRAFGKPVAQQANVQEWLADSRIEIDMARLLVLRTAWALDQPQPPADLREQIAAIKVAAARLQMRVVDRAIQVFGAMGLSPDTPLAWLFTWGRALRIMDGPDEVHLRTIARGELRHAGEQRGRWAEYFTTPEQMAGPVRLR
ncbi:acyl-CoA dehydrogenase family protein [Ramlibacter alkalitolerans]|uniref:Acyl-CoA dehydrogenase family protein n=1 Tax=Ramlibacter alkalitolerans TaxID=2039631 RepID=A0ABS1JP01_9BURK|nr:acyl-CoA dehydrogenase family protein [Ramlibacter alkalitolerans]MBL0425993.1 acyl-CoA dehydrogenase family protein [Ramlibacter alkalitolerans]